jgi:anti-anti-sigma regulatory factor
MVSPYKPFGFQVMLKITTHDDSGQTSFELEGRLTGAWVEELKNCWQQAAAANPKVGVRLKEVTFVDESGRRLLADMHNQGVTLAAEGCMMKAIVEEIVRGERP